jgi:uncharacterized protein HemY
MKTKIAYFKNATDIMKHTIHVAGTRCKLTVDIANYPKVRDKLDKLVKAKPRKPTIKADKRTYPVSGRYMDTASYVKAFWELNFKATTPDDLTMFYQELSTTPQQWPAEPVFEALEPVLEALEPVLEALEPLAIPVLTTLTIEDTASLPAWLTKGVPPAWLK